MTGAAATAWHATLNPRDAADVCLLTGLAADKLPDVLRHWSRKEAYVGNHLLNRIDPMDTKVHNPWLALRLEVTFFLSKCGKAIIDKRADVLQADTGHGIS